MIKETISALKIIVDTLNSFSEEELTALASKKARLKLDYLEGDRRNKAKSTELSDAFFAGLEACTSREDADAYIREKKIRKADLHVIAKHYEISVDQKVNANDLITNIIESVIGSKLKHETLLNANLHNE